MNKININFKLLSIFAVIIFAIVLFLFLQKNNITPPDKIQEDISVQTTQTLSRHPSGELTRDNSPLPKNATTFPFVIIILLTISLTVSVFLIVHLLFWRFKISDTQVSIVPNELVKLLNHQNHRFGQYSSNVVKYIKNVSQGRQITDAGILELQKSFAIFQDGLNKKDQEIERYKKGYDSAIYEKFLNKFIKFYICIKREADAPENIHSATLLEDLMEMLEDALLECNVVIKTPPLLALPKDYQEIIGSGNKIIETNQHEMHGKIAKVLFPSFILETQAGDSVLREARVMIYNYKEGEKV